MNGRPGMEVFIEKVGNSRIVRPVGDIDLSHAPDLRDRLAAVHAEQPDRVIIDLSGVPYMDSSGLATLVEAMQVSKRSGATLVLCSLQEKVRSIFEIARLDMVFKIVETPEEASEA